MAIIRFSDEEVFDTDSQEYEILRNAAEEVGDTPGGIVEIGSRRGGSAKIIIDSLVRTNNTNRAMFCIDPYGNIDYEQTNVALSVHHPNVELKGDPRDYTVTQPTKLDYDNGMRNRIIPSLYFYAYSAGLNFTFFCLEDTEFFERYGDGVPVYDEHKSYVDQYAFVFFDGPHTNEAVISEVTFFETKSPVGAVWVFDDIWMYDHDMIEEKYLFPNGFEILEKKSVKASYKKTS